MFLKRQFCWYWLILLWYLFILLFFALILSSISSLVTGNTLRFILYLLSSPSLCFFFMFFLSIRVLRCPRSLFNFFTCASILLFHHDSKYLNLYKCHTRRCTEHWRGITNICTGMYVEITLLEFSHQNSFQPINC